MAEAIIFSTNLWIWTKQEWPLRFFYRLEKQEAPAAMAFTRSGPSLCLDGPQKLPTPKAMGGPCHNSLLYNFYMVLFGLQVLTLFHSSLALVHWYISGGLSACCQPKASWPCPFQFLLWALLLDNNTIILIRGSHTLIGHKA